MTATTTAKPLRAVRKPEVLSRCGIANTHLYRLIKDGKFPKPIKITDRLVAWNEAEIDAWLAEKFSK